MIVPGAGELDRSGSYDPSDILDDDELVDLMHRFSRRGKRIHIVSQFSGISKRFRYVMSHLTGKVRILGISGGRTNFSYHEAKNAERTGELFSRKLDPDAAWLDDLHRG